MPLSILKRYFFPYSGNAYTPYLLRRQALLFILTVVLVSEGFLVANLIGRQTGNPFVASVVSSDIISLTNAERSQSGVHSLRENKLLDAAAKAKAKDMAVLGYFSHVGPDGKAPWVWISGAGYHYSYAGENLAVRFLNSSDVVKAWMASPSHKSNMVKEVYTDIGVGVAQGTYEGQPATYIVQYFAAPSQISEQTINSNIAAVSAAGQFTSFTDSLMRNLLRLFGDPQSFSNWILGASAAVMIVALALTFFVHLQVQPHHAIARGLVVAVFAVGFLTLNVSLVGSNTTPQSASVIDSQAVSTEYATFP